MKRVVYAVLCLLAAWPAHAASFDCKKAHTEVEKLVCRDAKLSRLDEEVSAAYKAALRDKEHAALVRQNHAQWLAGRGNKRTDCSYREPMPVCLKFAYLEHLSWLRLPFLRAVPAAKLPGTPMGGALSIQSATSLLDGNVLLLGDSRAYLYDPAANSVSEVGAPLVQGRLGPHTLLLRDGRVLVAGGSRPDHRATDLPNTPISDAELYDPATRKFTAAGHAPDCGSVTALQNGLVLFSGGCIPPFAYGGPLPQYRRDAELYDPATGKSVATGQLIAARTNHSATLLKNGKVLIVGGGPGKQPAPAELYDPATGKFSATGTPLRNRVEHAAILLPNGKVLVAGGRHSDEEWGRYYQSLDTLSSAELYDPATGRFSATGKPLTIMPGRSLMLLPDGKVLVAAQYAGWTGLERYDPATGQFSPVGKFVGYHDPAILLSNGMLLVNGRAIYDPAAGQR